MTRKTRSKKNIERKIVEIYLRLQKRQTKNPMRLATLRNRLQFFKDQLEELAANEETSNVTETDQTVTSLSTESVE